MSHLHAEKLVEELKENAKEFAQVAYDAVKMILLRKFIMPLNIQKMSI